MPFYGNLKLLLHLNRCLILHPKHLMHVLHNIIFYLSCTNRPMEMSPLPTSVTRLHALGSVHVQIFVEASSSSPTTNINGNPVHLFYFKRQFWLVSVQNFWRCTHLQTTYRHKHKSNLHISIIVLIFLQTYSNATMPTLTWSWMSVKGMIVWMELHPHRVVLLQLCFTMLYDS